MRGANMGMIFQEPMTSLNPVLTIGFQIVEAIRLHQQCDLKGAQAAARRVLDQVRIPDSGAIMKRYPHELSGGMRQRVMIAMALSCSPALLIADEPTTALDVTIQAQILGLIKELQREMDMGVIFITHDMGVVAEVADRVMVMRKGEVVENNDVHGLFKAPRHPYTKALMAAVPRLGAMQGTDAPAHFELLDAQSQKSGPPTGATAERRQYSGPSSDVILSVRNLVTRFDVRGGFFSRVRRRVHAVEHVSFDLHAGETLALVGESGCGKTTTGRSLMHLTPMVSGHVEFDGKVLNRNDPETMRYLRRNMQFVFQDPFASLNPRMRIGESIKEPMLIHGLHSGSAANRRVAELLERVGLDASMAQRWPHEFSGGQRQRICIARALSVNPKVLIADESVSALDVSIQAQIVNLLIDLQCELGIAYLFISHDMAVVERVSHRVAVMYLGQIVELGPRQMIFENPQHPYTRKLMQAVPVADPSVRRITTLEVSDIPSPVRHIGDEPDVKALVQVGKDHYVAQHSIGGAY
jgi:ABC-type glutathione transport system ATPase component